MILRSESEDSKLNLSSVLLSLLFALLHIARHLLFLVLSSYLATITTQPRISHPLYPFL